MTTAYSENTRFLQKEAGISFLLRNSFPANQNVP